MLTSIILISASSKLSSFQTLSGTGDKNNNTFNKLNLNHSKIYMCSAYVYFQHFIVILLTQNINIKNEQNSEMKLPKMIKAGTSSGENELIFIGISQEVLGAHP